MVWVSKPPSKRLVRPRHIPSRRLISSHSERPFADFDARPGAPSRQESRSQRGVEEIDRDRIVDNAGQPGRGHRPAIGTTVLVKPSVHLGKALAKIADRNAELDATREPALGINNHQL
jgi:hypothetical protein